MKPIFKTFIGIDPGYNGSIALYGKFGVQTIKNKISFLDIKEQIEKISSQYEDIIVGIEHVNMNPNDMKDPGKAFNIQKLFDQYRNILNVLDLQKIPYLKIMPIVWLKGLNVYLKGEDKTQRKNRYKYFAAENFRGIKVTDVNAASLCILTYIYEVVRADKLDINKVINRKFIKYGE